MRLGSKRWPVVAFAAACSTLGLSYAVQALTPHWSADHLMVTAPNLHFISGKALDRLHNGASVPYAFQLTLTTVPRSIALQRSLDRFVVSYDVWGETFSVVQAREPRRSVSHLAANAAEAWCIARLEVPSEGAPDDRDLWLRLEIRAEEAGSQSPMTDSGLSITSLIELFSRPARSASQEWVAETGPFHLRDLKR